MPQIAESAFVSEGAYVVGDVEIGEHSSVWPGVVIRGDDGHIRIGSYTHIQDNSVVHGSDMDIGDNVLIGHSCVIHGRKIGNHVLVGNNATILSRAEIGDFSIVASGAVVEEGTQVPSHSFLVGVPARERRLTEEQKARLLGESRFYAERAQQYKREGL